MTKAEPGSARTGRLLGNAAITLGGAVVGAGLAFGNEILMARIFGVELYGLFAIAFAMVKMAELLSAFGLRMGLLHFLPPQLKAGDQAGANGTVLAAIALPAVASVAYATVLWLVAPFIAEDIFGKPGIATFLRTLAFAIPFLSMTEILGNIGRGYGYAIDYALSRNLVPPFVYLVMLWALHGNSDAASYVPWAFVASHLIGSLCGTALVSRRTGRGLFTVKPSFALRELYGYSFPIFVSMTLYLVILWAGLLMIGRYLDAESAGRYRACMQLILLYSFVGQAFNAATSHLYAVFVREGRLTEMQKIYSLVIRYSVVVTVPVFFLIIMNGRELLGLLGPEFTAGVTALCILAVGEMVRSSIGHSGFVLVIGGHPKIETANAAIAAAANVGLNIFLIPAFGIEGAALSTCLTFVLLSILRVVQVKLVLSQKTLDLSLIRVALPYFVAGVPLVAWAGLMHEGALGDGLVAIVIYSGVALAVFAVLTWYAVFTAAERDAIGSRLRRSPPGTGRDLTSKGER